MERLLLGELRRRGLLEDFRDEIEMQFLMVYYFNSMHTFFWRWDSLPVEVYREMCRTVKREFPHYRDNPYLYSGIQEYEWYRWPCFPIVLGYWKLEGDVENIRILEQAPERVRTLSWLDTLEADLTEVELTWFKIIYMLLPG